MKKKKKYSQSKQTYSAFADVLLVPFMTTDSVAALELSVTNGPASYLAFVITFEEMRSPLEMNKCGIYVSINI